MSSGTPATEVLQAARVLVSDEVSRVYDEHTHTKTSRQAAIQELEDFAVSSLAITFPHTLDSTLRTAVAAVVREVMRRQVLERGVRADGRELGQLRDLGSEVDLLPRVHGSSVFRRGETEVLCCATLDSSSWGRQPNDIDTVLGQSAQSHFWVDYTFPSYAINSVQAPKERHLANRREVGHSALASRALRAVVPGTQEFDFTTRLTAEVTSSHGSSSMATVRGNCRMGCMCCPRARHAAGTGGFW